MIIGAESLTTNLHAGSIIRFLDAGTEHQGYITTIDRKATPPLARVCTKPGSYFAVELADQYGPLAVCDCGIIACTNGNH